jgi:glycosyltransferase involved in cell wall biosynthesis
MELMGSNNLPMRSGRHIAYIATFWAAYLLARSCSILCQVLRVAHVSAFVRKRLRSKGRVMFLAAFFPGNAGFEERAKSWANVLIDAGFRTHVFWCLPRDRFSALLLDQKVGEFHLLFMARRLLQCLQAPFFDAVIVQRELLLFNDYGGTFAEKFLLSLNKSVALDIDDDISAAKGEPRAISSFGRLLLESGTKFADSLRLYPRFIVGSSYLLELVRAARPEAKNGEIEIIPTCVDISAYPRKRYDAVPASTRSIAFGWIGSVGNLQYLDIVLPSLEAVARDYSIKLVVISGQAYRPAVRFEVENVPWSYETQGDSLQKIDIGLMPLLDTAVERGKCGFKLLQYMACGIVSIASAITTNLEILTDGEDGFLVQRDDWERVIRRVLAERHRFTEIGSRAVARVKDQYTFDANREAYLGFCQRLCGQEPTAS